MVGNLAQVLHTTPSGEEGSLFCFAPWGAEKGGGRALFAALCEAGLAGLGTFVP
jgi:hypothetical protein